MAPPPLSVLAPTPSLPRTRDVISPPGIQRFLRSHRHSLLCEQLGLRSQDAALTDEELALKLQAEEELACEGLIGLGLVGGAVMLGVSVAAAFARSSRPERRR